MNANRPVVLSVIQYQDEILSGKLSVLDLIDRLDGLHVAGIELRREIWPNYAQEIQAAREKLQRKGLVVTYATFSTLFSPDDAARKLLFHDIDTAKALGAPLLRVFPGAVLTEIVKPSLDAAREAVTYADSQGITLALENFGKTPGCRIDEIAAILEAIPSPALKTNIDIGNYTTHGENVLSAIERLGTRAVYAHLKDKSGASSDATTYLGGGVMPMEGIIRALNALPQQMIYCFEFAGEGEPELRIEKSVQFLNGIR